MRVIRSAVAAAALTLAVAGCDAGAPEPEPTAAAEAAPAMPRGIALSDARVQLPAVSGRPGVAYFTLSPSAGAPQAIAGVAVALVGRTEMHETVTKNAKSTMKPVTSVPLVAGETVSFAPGGLHAMLFDLDPKLRFEDATELTVTFDSGDKVTVPAKVTTINAIMVGEGTEDSH
ncbi:MAG: copper chaperone PCu(A)C [Novosphingobium sp.]